MNSKIAVFTGTRAEYGLLFWLLKDIKNDPELDLQLLVSGTHLSPEFGNTFQQIEADGFQIDEKVEMLLSSDSAVGTVKSMGLGIIGFSDALSRLNPDLLIVLGDRFEALAIAQTALIMQIPILHIHGGEITEGAFDDSIRHAITKLSYLHATSTDESRQRVIQLGESPDRVKNVGAIGLEYLNRLTLLTLEELSLTLDFKIKKPFFVVTYHAATNGEKNAIESFSALLGAINQFPSYQVILTYPNADEGGREIIKKIEQYVQMNPLRVIAIPSLGQLRYLSLISQSSAVIGNSSSGIIEVPAYDVPTVNIGSRQKGRLAAKSVINVAPITAEIIEGITVAIARGYKEEGEVVYHPYGDGDVSKKIIKMIKSLKYNPSKVFYNINFKEVK
ncbi:UDP-N-acetylglucosamine 2-epimerase (hydrolyzing) [Shewanella sp. 11B5]|uniref:UDP-N-acetylglucosamine 2-epimerase n=1 Tax=Shewanella sp. 11B5 TaxID=2058298 RepID=UPI000C7BC84C|nr:UDP-N-acetylglucosamine 2-epimerase [Shewanella sp. 11B5]PKH98637.1 UDP-N-acetylglucosamine 2-epimerase (hydrolyzing) [Shewanella sp. 11B5]